MKLTGENRRTRGGKSCPSATTYPTWTDPGSNMLYTLLWQHVSTHSGLSSGR